MVDGRTGMLVEAGNAQAWAAAIAAALDAMPQQGQMAEAGAHDVRQRFAPDSNLQQIMTLSGLSGLLAASH